MKYLNLLLIALTCLMLVGCSEEDKAALDGEVTAAKESVTSAVDNMKNASKESAVEVYDENTNGWQKFWNKVASPFTSKEDRALEYVEKSDLQGEVNKRTAIKFVPLILLILAVIIIIIISMLVGRGMKRKPINKVIIQQPAVVTATPSIQGSVYREAGVNYELLLQKMCSEKGLDYNNELSNAGGSARTAVESINLR